MIGNISLYQFLVPFFSLLMIVKAFSRFLRHKQTMRELVLWIILWVAASIISLFPDYTVKWLSSVSGIKSGVNALIFFALVILFYGFLHLFVAIENNERTITELIRKIALKDVKTKE